MLVEKRMEDVARKSADAALTYLSGSRSNMGDAALAACCLSMVKHSLVFCTRLEILDFSFCALSLLSWKTLRPLLENGVELPLLQTLHLVGNFRKDFGVDCYANGRPEDSPPSLVSFMADVCSVWESHPVLATVSVDPWLQSSAFVAQRAVKSAKARESAAKQRLAHLTARQSAPAGRLNRLTAVRASAMLHGVDGSAERQSVFVVPQQEVSTSLLDAARRTQEEPSEPSSPTASTAASSALVDFQLLERKYREKVTRAEEASWTALRADFGSHTAEASQKDRQRTRQVRAMGDLEGEMRDMIEQREEDARRKLAARWGRLQRM